MTYWRQPNVDTLLCLALIDCHGYGKSYQPPCGGNGKKLWPRKQSASRAPVFSSGKSCLFSSHGWNRIGSPGLRRAVYLLQLLPEMSAIIRERDALEVENDRLHAVLGLS